MSAASSKKYSLPRRLILKKKIDIQKVLKEGNRIQKNTFIVFIIPSKEMGVAFLVSKKIGNAVIRTRLKRLFREAFRLNKEKFFAKKVVFLLKYYTNDFRYIVKEMEELF